MAQPIIFDNFGRSLRAEAAAAPYEALGQGLNIAGQTIEQVLLRKQLEKEKEKHDRIVAMGAMVDKYGFKQMGPDFAVQFEKDTGIKFDRGPDGKPIVPQSTEEMVKERRQAFVKEHPEYEASALGLGKPPMTADEKHYKDEQMDLLHERNQAMETHYALEHDVRMAALYKDDRPSQFMYNPQTHELDMVGPGQGMSYKDLNGARFAVAAYKNKLDIKEKKAHLQYLLHKAEQGDVIDKAFAPALKVYLDPKTKNKADKDRAYAVMESIAKRNGETLPFSNPKEALHIWNLSYWRSEKPANTSEATAGEKPLTPDQEVDQLEKSLNLGR